MEPELGPLDPAWDRAPNDPVTTEFKRRARRRQAEWRSTRGFAFGEHPPGNANGSVLAPEVGGEFENFMSDKIRAAVRHRLASGQREPKEMLQEHRLLHHLLSSMPMCFNLFGELHQDPTRIGTVGSRLFDTDLPGREVRFEWSPARESEEFTNDKTAFDVALLYGASDVHQFVVGVETKYHEHANSEAAPDAAKRLPRYRSIVEQANKERGVFKSGWEAKILGTPLQQIWRDHLLLLSLIQHPSKRWTDGKYVLVYPAGNASFAAVAEAYQDVLDEQSTFDHKTVEDLLDAHVLHDEQTEVAFRERYLW